MNAQPGLLAKKLGMTQVFLADGTRVPVTVLAVKGNTVLAHRTTERDGYVALQVGFDEQKPTRMKKPDLGRFKAANVSPRKLVREFRCDGAALEKFPIGADIPLDLFAEGTLVDVTGTSKGKGFQGVMKRHHMKGKPDTHGVHEYFRHGGSVGCRLTPGRIFPGKRMGGHMGQDTKTIQNVRVAKIDTDLGVVMVRGSIPGATGDYVTIRTAHKAALRQAHKEAKAAQK
jgi:large subunit ribosomal protein L3